MKLLPLPTNHKAVFTSHQPRRWVFSIKRNINSRENTSITMRLSLARRLHSTLGAPSTAAIASYNNYSTLFPSQYHGNTAKHQSSHISASRKYTTYSQLPSEHQMVYEMCRKFADEELAPNAGKWDQKHEFPTDAVDKLVSSIISSSATNSWLMHSHLTCCGVWTTIYRPS